MQELSTNHGPGALLESASRELATTIEYRSTPDVCNRCHQMVRAYRRLRFILHCEEWRRVGFSGEDLGAFGATAKTISDSTPTPAPA